MITETTEIDAWTPDVVITQLKEYRGDKAEDISPAALAVIIAVLELEPVEREAVLRALPAFMCMECGEASCLHGYSDE